MKNKLMSEFKESKIRIKSLKKLEEYIELCIHENRKAHTPFETENHHILPQAKTCFPQYSDLNKHSWNSTFLTYETHYIAHSLLAEAINHNGMYFAWLKMNGANFASSKIQSGVNIIGAARYSELKKLATIANTKEKLVSVVKDDGSFGQVTTAEFKEGNFKGVNFDRITVYNKNTKKYNMIYNHEFDENIHERKSSQLGKVNVKCKNTGKNIKIDFDEYDENIHEHPLTGRIRVVCKDSGNISNICPEDFDKRKYFYKIKCVTTKELAIPCMDVISMDKMYVTKYKFQNNPNLVKCSKKQIQYLNTQTGELKKLNEVDAFILDDTWVIYSGIKVCPHCGVTGTRGNMVRYHFKNCINM